MSPRIIVAILCLLAPLAQGAMTVGWKIPLRALTYSDEMGERFPKLDKPPGESAFFQAGDELWDVSRARSWPDVSEKESDGGDPFEGVNPPPPWRGEWLVWNARSGMFVARGSWQDILAVDAALGFKERPHLIRSVFELERGGKPARSLSVASRSGEEASMSVDGMEVDFTASASESGSTADLMVYASWGVEKQEARWEVTTGLEAQDRSRHLLACQGSGDTAWKLFLTTRWEAVDGTPESEARWIEMAGKLKPWTTAAHEERPFRRPLGELFAGSYPVDAEFLTRGRPGLALPVVEVPEAFKTFVKGSVLDVGERLKDLAIDVSKPGFFGGFDPATSRLLIIGDSDALGMWETFGPGYDGIQGSLWLSTNEASGGWGLTARSGNKAKILRHTGSGEEDLLFEIEPVVGADSRLIDVRLKADIVSGHASRGRLESAVTLEMGKPMEVARRAGAEGGEVPLEVTAAMVPFNR